MKKMIPTEAREGFAINKAYEFLNEFKRLTLPINLYDLCSFHDITLMTYSQLKYHGEELGIQDTQVNIKKLPKDGFVIMLNDTPYIFYNEKRKIPRRIRFTIAHEIGHIILGHLDDFDLTVLRRDENYSKQYAILEKEADNFARNILTPYPLLRHIQLDEKNRWKDYFQITNAAAKTRKLFFNKDRNLVLPDVKKKFKEKFKDLITLPLVLKKCVQCKSISTLKNADFCIYCGSNKLTKTYPQIGDVKLIYPGIEADQNGKALKCPKCDNEEVFHKGEFCKTCGMNLVNKCTYVAVDWNGNVYEECGEILPGNARHCYICGHKSTFFENDLLQSWEVVQKAQKEQRSRLEDPFAITPRMTVPSSDEFPF